MQEEEKQEKIKQLTEKQGISMIDNILCFRLDSIPNWYAMMDGAVITCAVCEGHKLTVEYPKDFKREHPVEKEGVLYSHRMVEYTCPECDTKMRYDNHD